MRKWQTSAITQASTLLSIASSIIKLIELDAEDLDTGFIRVYPNILDYDIVEKAVVEGLLRVYVDGASWISESKTRIVDLNLDIVIENKRLPNSSIKLKNLYERIPLVPLIFDSTLLRSLAYKTFISGIEYIIIYSLQGSLYVFEGERFRVVIPSVNAVGKIHTHPDGGCGFSKSDVESSVYSLADLSFFEAIATKSCYFYMARVGFMDVEDYIKLLNYGEISKPLKLKSIILDVVNY
ncbi:MAG: hypothetical protein QXR02_00695 [Acidilobaceae archaeon]